MLTRVKCLLISALFCTALSVQAEQGRAQLDQFLNDLTSLEANFKQRLTDEEGTLIEESEGQFYLQRPGKFRWEYTLPFAQSIIADGAKLWIYDQDLEQVTVHPLERALSSTPARLLSGDLQVDEEFEVKEMGEADGVNWLSLQPKDTEGQFLAIRLGFDPEGLKTMAVADNFGQVTKITFVDIRRNAAIDGAQFNFTPPVGVDIIDTSEER